MSITYQKEFFVTLIPELPELLMGEYEEMAEDKTRQKLNFDFCKYTESEIAGVLHIMTMRADGRLVGYLFNFVHTALQFADLVCGASDIMYVLPEFRRGFAGVKLFIENEKMLRDLQVKKALVTLPANTDKTRFMKRLKYVAAGSIFCKWL